MAQTYDLASVSPPSAIKTGDIINCSYSGTYKTITLPKGTYKLECWGAQGGSYNTTYIGGKGGYSVGTITLTKSETFYLYAGGQGTAASASVTGSLAGGFNGGGRSNANTTYRACSGGGGSDIRIGQTSLYARVIVAGGGGGAIYYKQGYNGGAGGGTSGVAGAQYNASYKCGAGGTATAAGDSYYGTTKNSASYGTVASFGNGGSASTAQITGGGGGWYGGGYSRRSGAGGGSGYVYTSSTASQYPTGCALNTTHYLTDASTTAGNTSFTDYSGSTVTGHTGNGAVRITVLYAGPQITNIYLKIGENNWKKLFDLTSKELPINPITIKLITRATEIDYPVVINGEEYYTTTDITIMPPTEITFTLTGGVVFGQGTVILNGETIFETNQTSYSGTETFTWTVYSGYNEITINYDDNRVTEVTITTA